MTSPRLILASGSPRRSALLAGLGLEFEVRPVDLDESRREGEEPEALVLRLAREKALERTGSGEVILAADTMVVLDRKILGKPADARDAERMLASLEGRRHVVFTGVAVHDTMSARTVSRAERSLVSMAPLSAERIAWYVGTGEPMDKAGSYAIQGLGAFFVDAVEGSYTNVVGLPLPLVRRLFAELGHDILSFSSDRT